MTLPVVELYTSMECPYAYLAVYRLRQVWPEFAGRLDIAWRALSLEYVNEAATPKPANEVEKGLMQRIEPGLPVQPWPKPDWQWPVTFWPAFEALACAQAQSHDAALAMSWALRHAFFAEGQVVSLRHEVLAVAGQVAAETDLDPIRFEDDWDAGRYKGQVIAESHHGWKELNVNGSATFVLPDGGQITNPAVGEIDFDEKQGILRGYAPYEGDPLEVYRTILRRAIGA